MLKEDGQCDDCDGPECESCGGAQRLSESTETTGYVIFQGDDMDCPKCGSENVSTERRIDGMKMCLDCDYKWRNVAQAGHVVTSRSEDITYKLFRS